MKGEMTRSVSKVGDFGGVLESEAFWLEESRDGERFAAAKVGAEGGPFAGGQHLGGNLIRNAGITTTAWTRSEDTPQRHI